MSKLSLAMAYSPAQRSINYGARLALQMNPQDTEMLRHICRCPRMSNQLFRLLVQQCLVAETVNVQRSAT